VSGGSCDVPGDGEKAGRRRLTPCGEPSAARQPSGGATPCPTTPATGPATPFGTRRPRYFSSGSATHGDGYVPAEPVPPGCMRVGNEAIDGICTHDVIPLGTPVWVYS
jgi:hypothetical protein